MLSCTSAFSVLLLMTVTLYAVCESATPTVKVKLHDSAVLPCYDRCSGVVRWTIFHKPTDILAECDQTSCRSVKEGYQMIYNQYLQGDFSLIITEADYRKRGPYTADCDKKDLCDVRLRIEPLKTTVHKKVGETLVLGLDVSDKVEVICSSTGEAGTSRNQTFRVQERSLQSSQEYTDRVFITSALELKGVKESDSGVYTVRDTSTKEVICIYTVIVHGDSEAQGIEQKHRDPTSSPPSGQGAALPGWVSGVLGGLVGVCVLCVVLVVVIGLQWRKIKHLQKESANKSDPQKNSSPQTETDNKRSSEEGKNLLQQNSIIQNPP